ncbi:MAG: hypothetical protein ACRC11_16530, partial [Xenococcaceae cyanobacterium]
MQSQGEQTEKSTFCPLEAGKSEVSSDLFTRRPSASCLLLDRGVKKKSKKRSIIAFLPFFPEI